jgi:uracil-DNA glycosylase
MHPKWQELLKKFESDLVTIENLHSGKKFNPHRIHVMRALFTNPEEVSVALFGQDPYPNPSHAIGLAFAVPREIRPLPASLRNIYKEMKSDVDIDPALHGDLTSWVSQGVCLVNRSLTHFPGTPTNTIWMNFTNEIARILGNLGCVAILWGKEAQSLSEYFPTNSIISSAHPSPLSAYRGFFGSRPFSKANEILLSQNKTPIDWKIK